MMNPGDLRLTLQGGRVFKRSTVRTTQHRRRLIYDYRRRLARWLTPLWRVKDTRPISART